MPTRAPIITSASLEDFTNGLVFGFDLGTASIGYAVRHGETIIELGSLICPEEVGDLAERRTLRRQRRTLRAKKYRRDWLAAELEKIGLSKPTDANRQSEQQDHVSWRIAALTGETLAPWKLHAALSHLCRKRGYMEVPWMTKAPAERQKVDAENDEEGQVRIGVETVRAEIKAAGLIHPCELLAHRRTAAGISPDKHWSRHTYWPRDLIEGEFRAIAQAQKSAHPNLTEKIEWLLYGDTDTVEKHGRSFRVYDKRNSPGGENPGALGLRWPRFNNRSPDLDRFRPYDEAGRPQHVVSRDRDAFKVAQFEVALLNLRVNDAATGKSVSPSAEAKNRHPIYSDFVIALRREWESPNKKTGRPTGQVSEARLKKLAAPHTATFTLKDDHPALTPLSTSGRSAFSSPTLEKIRRGELLAPDQAGIQPILIRKRPDGTSETPEQALTRFLGDITAPLIRHRLLIFSRLLDRLSKAHGGPDMIVSEAVRSLALGKKAKAEHIKRQKENERNREATKAELRENGSGIGSKAIQRYRLWKEAGCVCPFCLNPISSHDLLDHQKVDIEHLVPRARQVSNEWDNLTVAHTACNRERKRDRTPHEAFHDSPEWEHLAKHARDRFKGKKLEIFLSPQAEELLERNADLQQTAYIARLVRATCLIRFGWIGEDGRDPLVEKDNPALRFQVTNGALTSRLRGAWKLNGLLHPLPAGVHWDDLTEEEQRAREAKNRGDHRHHALDALVIAHTLPWAARRTADVRDRNGVSGWWRLDPETRRELCDRMPLSLRPESVRSLIEKCRVDHHVSRSPNKKGYMTTIYGERTDDRVTKNPEKIFVAREPLSGLKATDFKNSYPKELGVYLDKAYAHWENTATDAAGQLKKAKGNLPESFISTLCFAAFQQWRHNGSAGEYRRPHAVKVPIRSVKIVGVKDTAAVHRAHPAVNGFVKRHGFKEVRLNKAADGSGIVPVFVPYFENDKVPPGKPITNEPPLAVIRQGEVVELKLQAAKMPPGRYIITTFGQETSSISPPHLSKEGRMAEGLKDRGYPIGTNSLIKALGLNL
jgi:5-methylcytosine-specific restriction endonuclease McrA